MRLWTRLVRRLARAAEATLTAAEGGHRERRQQLPARLIDHAALLMDERRLARPFVDDLGNPGGPDDAPFGRQRAVQNEPLLAVHHPGRIDPCVGTAEPKAGVAEHRRHGRHDREMLLVDEAELALVYRIKAEPHAQRVEDDVPGAVSLLDLRNG